MFVFLDFIAIALAGDAIATAWFYGSIFANWREALEERGGKLGELAGCVLCLSYHICFALTLLLWLSIQLASILLPDQWSVLAYLPRALLYALAATDLVHWLQGERPIPVDDESGVQTTPKTSNNNDPVEKRPNGAAAGSSGKHANASHIVSTTVDDGDRT